MTHWLTRATVDLSARVREDATGGMDSGALLSCLADRLRRHRPRTVLVEGSELVLQGPVSPMWRWWGQLWAVPGATVSVKPAGEFLVVHGEIEMRGPIYLAALLLSQTIFMLWLAQHAGILLSAVEWIGASAAIPVVLAIGASIERARTVWVFRRNIVLAVHDAGLELAERA